VEGDDEHPKLTKIVETFPAAGGDDGLFVVPQPQVMREVQVRAINFGVVRAEAGCRLEHFIGVKLDDSEIEGARASIIGKSNCAIISGVAAQPGGIIVKLFVDHPKSCSENIVINVEAGDRNIELKGVVTVGRQSGQNITINAAAGSRGMAEIAFDIELWKSVRYRASLDPPLKEFSLTEGKGIVRGGAKILPFQVIYTPGRKAKTAETKLVLQLEDTGEIEWNVVGVCTPSAKLAHLSSFGGA
jgi:hypothetical protein